MLFTIVFCYSGQSQDFEVAPVVMNFSVEPNNNSTKKLTIRNHSDQIQDFTIKLSDYIIDESNRRIKAPLNSTERSLAKNLSFSPSFFTLNPNESISVDVMVSIPSMDTETKWGVLSVEATNERTELDIDKDLATGIRLSPKIAVYVIQSPKSNTKYSAKIESFIETSEEGVSDRSFKVVVKNVGEKEIQAKVSLLLSNLQTGEEIEVDMKQESLYPSTLRTFEFILGDIPAGKYALAAILDYGKHSNLEGAQIIIDQK